MADWIVVEADVEEVKKALSGTAKSLTTIQRQTIAVMAKGAVKAIKAGINSSTTKRTGELLKCYGYRIKKDGSSGSVYPRGVSGSHIFPKVFVQNYGHTGETKKAKSWTVKPKGFIQRGQDYLRQGSYSEELNNLVEKELKKYWG